MRRKMTDVQMEEWANLLTHLADVARARILNDLPAMSQAIQACAAMGWAVLIERNPNNG